MIAWVTEIKVRAERRAGEMLREMEKAEQRRTAAKGRPKASTNGDASPTLKKLGVTRDQSSDWQRLTEIPEPEFERRRAQRELTSGELERRRGRVADASMSNLTADGEVQPTGVRTPLRGDSEGASLCPVCGQRPLRGAQTVCSPRCRVSRSRQRREQARQVRDGKIRQLLIRALGLLREEGP